MQTSSSCKSFPHSACACVRSLLLLSRSAAFLAEQSADRRSANDAVWGCRCVLTKRYNAALPILSHPAYDVDPELSGMTAQDFLLYAYYGGLIHIGASGTRPQALASAVVGQVLSCSSGLALAACVCQLAWMCIVVQSLMPKIMFMS